MSEHDRDESIVIQRVLVAVDESPSSRAALEAAVNMAARFRAELLGLFVEDVNVLRLAELPFIREAGEYSARGRRVERQEIERQLRARSRNLRRIFRALAEQRTVRSSFRVTRGSVSAEIQSAAQEADVLVIGRYGWSQIRRRRLGSTARAACCSEAPSVTMVLREGMQLHPPVLVIYDGSERARKALIVAASLVEETWGPLRVLLLADGEGDILMLRRRASERLQSYKVMRQYQVLTRSNLPKLERAIRRTEGGTLIMPADMPLLREEAILDLLDKIDIPVLLVR